MNYKIGTVTHIHVQMQSHIHLQTHIHTLYSTKTNKHMMYSVPNQTNKMRFSGPTYFKRSETLFKIWYQVHWNEKMRLRANPIFRPLIIVGLRAKIYGGRRRIWLTLTGALLIDSPYLDIDYKQSKSCYVWYNVSKHSNWLWYYINMSYQSP